MPYQPSIREPALYCNHSTSSRLLPPPNPYFEGKARQQWSIPMPGEREDLTWLLNGLFCDSSPTSWKLFRITKPSDFSYCRLVQKLLVLATLRTEAGRHRALHREGSARRRRGRIGYAPQSYVERIERKSCMNNWLAAGEIRDAKSLKERGDFPKISRATSVVVDRQRRNTLSSGRELNSATKLITHPPMQLMVRSG